MEFSKAFKSITYILGGSLLYQYNGVADGWTAGLAAVFGFTIFIIGLDMLKEGLDDTGKSGVGLMRVGALVGGMAALIDLVPLLSLLAGLGFIASFLLILLGLFKLQKSEAIGPSGRSGARRLIYSMGISILAAMISMIPIVGGVFASIVALVAMVLSFTGWLKIQDGLLEPELAMTP